MSCDYCKVIVHAEPDLFTETYLEEWYQAFGAESDGNRKRWSLTALGPGFGGKRKYALEVWGEPAKNVRSLEWERWHPWLVRMDNADTFHIGNEEVIDRLYSLSRGGDSRLNVTRYSSRNRSKRHGRSGGGEGIAFGSHRSDFRFSVYKRYEEPLKVETQMSGNRLRRLVERTVKVSAVMGDENYDSWTSLLAAIWNEGDSFMRGNLMTQRELMDMMGYPPTDEA